MAGVQTSGFVSLTREEIVAQLNADFIAEFGTLFDTSPESPDGQEIGIFADTSATMWEMGEDSFNSYNPATANDAALDNCVRLNGISRFVDIPSKAYCYLTASNPAFDGTSIPAGSIVANTEGVQFSTDEAVVLPAYVIVTCTELGAITVNVGEIDTVVTEVEGWDEVTNPEAGVTGIVRETNTQLRLRRERSVVRQGTDTEEAIVSAVSELGVASVIVVDNSTEVPVEGIPAKSFHTIVDGGIDVQVARAIASVKPIGIPSFGSTSVTFKDSQGIDKTINFSRPVDEQVKIEVTVTKGAEAPANADATIKESLRSYVNELDSGATVVWAKLFQFALVVDFVEVDNIRLTRLADNSLQEASLPMSPLEKARLEDVNIVIVEV